MHVSAPAAPDPSITFWADRNFRNCQQAARRQHAQEHRRRVQQCVERFMALAPAERAEQQQAAA